jgi:hypothetical protein
VVACGEYTKVRGAGKRWVAFVVLTRIALCQHAGHLGATPCLPPHDAQPKRERRGRSTDSWQAGAALRAIESFSDGGLAFELIGVKSIRVFDANVVIVSIVNRHDGPQKLLGSCLVEDDPVRGAVIAVLNATNRVLGNFIATR